MKKWLLAIVAVHFLILTDVGVAAAVTIQNKTSVAVSSLTGCKRSPSRPLPGTTRWDISIRCRATL